MARILVAGVAVLDFIFTMKDFPRTAQKYRADGAAITGGGNAANAAVAIARLGGTALLAARLGNDQVADLIMADLEAEGVKTDHVRRFASHRSSFSSIYVDAKGDRQIMNYRDTSLSMDAGWLRESLPDFDVALADTRWPHGAEVAMQAARDRGVPGIIDAEAPVMEAKEAVFAASHVAFSAQGVRDFTDEADVEKAALVAQERLPGQVIVTDGALGAVEVLDGELIWHPAAPVTAVDTLGAGDVWHGAFALCLAQRKTQRDAIRFANAAATLKCTRAGGRNGAPDRKAVDAFMAQHPQ